MRILVVCGAGYVYGREIVTLSLIRGLRDRGHDVRCATSTWTNGEFEARLEQQQIPRKALALGFISKTLGGPAIRMTLDQLMKLPSLWIGYRRFLKDFQPDAVLHSNFHHVLLLAPFLNKDRDYFHIHDHFPATRFYTTAFKMLNRRLRLFIGVSSFIRDSLLNLGIPSQKANSVLNGVSVNGKSSQIAVASSPGAPVKIGIVGQIGEWKGHTDLVDALNSLKNENLNFEFLIFGGGDAAYVDSLKKRIHDYGFSERTRWQGFVTNAGDIYRSLDICVVPSRNQDPCPTVALEAAHYGLPLVVTRTGGLPEIVINGETGYIAAPRNPADLAMKLKELLVTPKKREKMGRAARKHALQTLSAERMIGEMETLFLDRH